MARMGAKVTGADADPVAIEVAKEHAEGAGLKITYENKPAEELGKNYDVVLALEIIEHYGIEVAVHIRDWLQNPQSETLKADHAAFAQSQFHLIATPHLSLQAAATAARE